MAKRVAIIDFDDETSNAVCRFEDDVLGITYDVGIWIPEDLTDEDDVLNFCATHWPHEVMRQKAKPAVARNPEVKKIIGLRKIITDKVDFPSNNPRHPDFNPGPP